VRLADSRRKAAAQAAHLGFRHMLPGVLALYLIIIIAPLEKVGAPLRVAFAGVLLLMAIRTRRRAGPLTMPAIALATILVAATLIAVATGSQTVLTCVGQGSTVILVVVTILVLGRTLLAAGEVAGPAVRGVLTIYLLLGLLFSSVHSFFAALITNYLSGAGTHPTTSDTLYFSLSTLTTVGYGDIVPVANVARAVASIEALIGQLYLVSVVAAVVSRFVPASRRAAPGGNGGNTAGSAGAAPPDATDEPPGDSPSDGDGDGDGP